MLTDMTAQVSGRKLGTVELVSWKSQDGTTIEGVLHKPADHDPGRKPAIEGSATDNASAAQA